MTWKKSGKSLEFCMTQSVGTLDGNIVDNIDEVLQHWKIEYENLFAKQTSSTFDDEFYNNALRMLQEWENDYAEMLIYGGEGFGAGNTINDCLNIPVSIEEVKKVLISLRCGKAVGIDNLPNEILKHKNILPLLHSLYAKCFETGLLPDIWKMSIIKPIS